MAAPPLPARPDAGHIRAARAALLAWYARAGRDLPWRRTRDPYAVLVAEVMLQQTQVDRVLPHWRAWLERFPSLEALARAPRGEVIRAWQGLGYNLRAVRLHEIARQAVERFGGGLPGSREGLLGLKGIGRYTAGAVACFAFGEPVAVVDTNIRRVLGRVFLGEPCVAPGRERAVERLAGAVVPADRGGEVAYAWNQALMDLGATVCSVARPACRACPLLAQCRAAPLMAGWPEQRRLVREARGAYAAAARRRFFRGRVVDVLRSLGAHEQVSLAELGPRLKADFGEPELAWLEGLVRKLAADGLVELLERAGPGPAELRARLPDERARR